MCIWKMGCKDCSESRLAPQALADELSRRLGRDRCWKVRWPSSTAAKTDALGLGGPEEALSEGSVQSSATPAAQQPGEASDDGGRKDANEVLMKDGHEALRQCLAGAEAYPIRGLFRYAHTECIEGFCAAEAVP